MRKVIQVLYVKEWESNGKKHKKTYVLLDDGTEASGYSEFKVGDECKVFFDDKWNEVKVRHGKDIQK